MPFTSELWRMTFIAPPGRELAVELLMRCTFTFEEWGDKKKQESHREQVIEWNRLREFFPEWKPLLSNKNHPLDLGQRVINTRGLGIAPINLSGAKLWGVNLRSAQLWDANLSGAKLFGADFRGAKLLNANLSGAFLRKANFSGAILSDADLSAANLFEADLSRAKLNRAKLNEANLTSANLVGANLANASLIGANLANVDLSGAKLLNAILIGAELLNTNLCGTSLKGANLSEAALTHANLSGAELIHANLSECQLTGANLSGAFLFGADIRRANLRRANLSGASFREANLSEANLSYATIHRTVMSEISNRSSQGNFSWIRKIKLWERFRIGREIASDPPTDFRLANLTNARLHYAGYNPRKLLLHCGGINVDGATGNRILKRDLQEQSSIDMLHERWAGSSNIVIWHLLRFADFGRSVGRIALIVIFIAFFYGVIYSMYPGMLKLPKDGIGDHWFAPFYYSIVTYSTLGFGDITPKTGAGMFVVVTEVVAGYLSLGGLMGLISNRMGRLAS